MRSIKKAVLSIALVVFAIPIFSSALAQTQQTRTLLEMQALRDEVAQLRDMLERQGRTIRLLQRQMEQGQSNSSSGSNTSDATDSRAQAANNFPQQVDGYQGAQAPAQSTIDPFVAAPSAASNLPAGQQGNAAYSPPLPDPSQPNNAQTSQRDADFYRPFEPNAENPVSDASATQQPGNGVSALPTAQDGFPPVVDRSIGGTRTGEQSVSQQAPSYQGNGQGLPQEVPQAAVPEYQQPATDQGLSTRSLEPFNRAPASALPSTAATTGVVAVPSLPQANAQTPAQPSAAEPALARPSVQEKPVTQQAAVPTSQLSEDEMYNQGFELLKQSKFEEASTVFEQQIQTHPQGSLADDAHYWISEAMTMVSNTEAARTNLRAIVDNYPQSSRVPDARLRLAYIEERKGNLIEARILLQEVVNNYPQSDAAIAAKNRLETLQ